MGATIRGAVASVGAALVMAAAPAFADLNKYEAAAGGAAFSLRPCDWSAFLAACENQVNPVMQVSLAWGQLVNTEKQI